MDMTHCYNIVTRLRETALKQKKVEVRNMEKMMESALKKNGYYFDFDTKVLTVTKEFAEKASDIDSVECAKFLDLRNRIPGVIMRVRETKSGKKKLTYPLMLKYIARMPNGVELVQEYERVKLMSKCQKSPYKFVTNWFEAKFPNYDKFLTFDEEGNVNWAAVLKKEDTEEVKSADNVVEMPMAAGM